LTGKTSDEPTTGSVVTGDASITVFMQCLSGDKCDGPGAAIPAAQAFKPGADWDARLQTVQAAKPAPKRSRLSAIAAHSVKPPHEIRPAAHALRRRMQQCGHG
jgi:hypothetical protein